MDFYVIPPLSNLELMDQGDRYFCLTQLYKRDPNYREFFRQRVADGKWVTLDNGAGDHDLVSERDVIMAAVDLCPSEVIPPDVLFDGVQTILNLESFIYALRGQFRIAAAKMPEIFAVPQGNNLSEWLFVYEYMLRHPQVDTIGLSKITVPKILFDAAPDQSIKEARHMMFDTLKSKEFIKKPIHLLGMGDPREFAYYKNEPLMRSTDSCNSVWSAMNDILFENDCSKRIPTPKDYFDREMSRGDLMFAEFNIEWMKKNLH